MRIVGDEQIRPAVLIVIERHHAEALAIWVVQAGLCGHVGELALAQVPIELGRSTLVGFRRAIALDGPVQRTPQVIFRRPDDVIRHEQIQKTVLIVVEPCRTGSKNCIADARCRRHVEEMSAAFVVQQAVTFQRGDVDIVPAVVIVIADADPQTEGFHVEPAAGGDVSEAAVLHVAVQSSGGGLTFGVPLVAVQDENVEPAVSIDIHKRTSGTQRLRQPFLAFGSVRVLKLNACFLGDVDEPDCGFRFRRRWFRRASRQQC